MSLHPAPESLFWYFVSERHAIYLRRQAGQPKPWTTDPILQQYKFTNVFRELDRGTVWLREHFLEPHRDDDLGLIAFNICWYRAFNYIGTGERLGWQTEWNPSAVKATLTAALARGEQVFTGAHIIRSEFGRPKIDSIVDVCSNLYSLCTEPDEFGSSQSWFANLCLAQRSLKEAFEQLLTVPYIGPFMAHEFVIDMRSTRLLEDAIDANTWSNAGPGAKRGLERLGLPFHPPAKAIESMVYLLEQSRTQLADFVPPLELHQIEFCLCECDKYARVKYGEGIPRSRYKGVA
jgi:hypothetical protein